MLVGIGVVVGDVGACVGFAVGVAIEEVGVGNGEGEDQWTRAQTKVIKDVTITTIWIQDTNGTIVTIAKPNTTVLPMDGTFDRHNSSFAPL